jgi:hypothetical protein
MKIGIAGEHLVCTDLIMQGHNAFLSDQGLPYDIVADIGGRLLKVQVKTTRTNKDAPQRERRTPAYIFNLKRCGKKNKKTRASNDVDLYAMVCLETKQVGYILPSVITTTVMIRVDKFRGQYGNEMHAKKYKKVFELKGEGLSNTEISKKLNIHLSAVGRMVSGKSKPRKEGLYFSDISLNSIIKDI